MLLLEFQFKCVSEPQLYGKGRSFDGRCGASGLYSQPERWKKENKEFKVILSYTEVSLNMWDCLP